MTFLQKKWIQLHDGKWFLGEQEIGGSNEKTKKNKTSKKKLKHWEINK